MLTDDWDLGEAHWQLTGKGEIYLGVRLPQSGVGDGHGSPPVLGPDDLGRWIQLVTVYDKSTNMVSHYLNGERVSQGRLRVPITLRIGAASIGNWRTSHCDFDPVRSLNGRIDEFAILRRLLSSSEIKMMFEVGKPSS